jgi:hypothetical protein
MSAAVAGSTQWTRRTDDLWTGRLRDAPAGTIERGRRFTYIDVAGGAHPGYRTLDAAQRAADQPLAAADDRDGRGGAWFPTLLTTVSGVLAIDAVLIGGAMLLRY